MDVPVLADGPDLRLRGHTADDLPGIVAQCQDPDMVRWTTVPAPYGPADARRFLDGVAKGWRAATSATFAVELDGSFAGSVDLRHEAGGWVEVGYGLASWARGRGIMTRALRLALGYAFETVGAAGVQWRAVIGNQASRRVAEKCGFRIEGAVRGLLVHRNERFDGWIGTLLRADWLGEPMESAVPTFRQVVLDTLDARRAAQFYRELLGLSYAAGSEPPPAGRPDPAGADWLVLCAPGGHRLLAFAQVDRLPPASWPDPAVPQQLHLDFRVRSRAELDAQHARVLALGGRLLHDRAGDPVEALRVYADPDGHPFCLFVLA